jgi:hypothetical protein
VVYTKLFHEQYRLRFYQIIRESVSPTASAVHSNILQLRSDHELLNAKPCVQQWLCGSCNSLDFRLSSHFAFPYSCGKYTWFTSTSGIFSLIDNSHDRREQLRPRRQSFPALRDFQTALPKKKRAPPLDTICPWLCEEKFYQDRSTSSFSTSIAMCAGHTRR